MRLLLTAAFKLPGFQMNYLMCRNISDLLSAFVNNNKPLFVLTFGVLSDLTEHSNGHVPVLTTHFAHTSLKI